MRFDLTTKVSPEQVLPATTDFTDRRLEIWHRALDPKVYEVHELGDTWAVAREGPPRVPGTADRVVGPGRAAPPGHAMDVRASPTARNGWLYRMDDGGA